MPKNLNNINKDTSASKIDDKKNNVISIDNQEEILSQESIYGTKKLINDPSNIM